MASWLTFDIFQLNLKTIKQTNLSFLRCCILFKYQTIKSLIGLHFLSQSIVQMAIIQKQFFLQTVQDMRC